MGDGLLVVTCLHGATVRVRSLLQDVHLLSGEEFSSPHVYIVFLNGETSVRYVMCCVVFLSGQCFTCTGNFSID